MRWIVLAVALWMAPAAQIAMPIQGLKLADVHDSFNEVHNGHPHEAVDIMAKRGTPVHAVVSGTIARLFTSKAGGITAYEFDDQNVLCYYYAHLDGYAAGIREGAHV